MPSKLLVCALLLTNPIKVVTTGDSITNGYGGWRLQNAFNASPVDADVVTVACGGTNSIRYTAAENDPCTDTRRDFTAEVLGHDPDVVVFMLGTNDAFQATGAPSHVERYRQDVSGVLQRLGQAVNGRGQHPIVIVNTLIPILSRPDADAVLDNDLNPWLQTQTEHSGFVGLDLNHEIQQEPNWEGYYNDGIHLWANGAAGYLWMADRVRDTAVAALQDEQCRCYGDLDCDQQVGLSDLAVLLAEFGGGPAGDLNHDGVTDLSDLAGLLARIGASCSSP